MGTAIPGALEQTGISHTPDTCGTRKEQAKPLSCHCLKSRAPNTEKLRVWNGLTAGPDIHRFSIEIFSQDLRGQITWGASKTCSRREGRGTLNPLSLSLSPYQQFPPCPFSLLMLLLHKLLAHGQQEMTGSASCSARNLNQRASPCSYQELPVLPRGSNNTVLTTARLTVSSHRGPGGALHPPSPPVSEDTRTIKGLASSSERGRQIRKRRKGGGCIPGRHGHSYQTKPAALPVLRWLGQNQPV